MSWSTVGTIVGAVVGAYFPGVGAAAGAMVGGAVGGSVDMATAPTSRLEDTSAAKVSFGAPILLTFGHPRIGGNVVWCSPAIEAGTLGGNKKGGGGQKVYKRHLLVVLGEQESGPITRIWRQTDSKLIWNRLSSATDETIDAQIEEGEIEDVIYYPGGPSQLPDQTYSTFIGDDFSPAYRGRPTAALIGVSCGPSGQLPALSLEVAGKDAGDNSGRTKRIKKDWAQADYRGSPPEGSSMGGLHVIGISGDGIGTYRDGDTTQVNSVPQGVPINQPAQGNGDIALAVWGHPGGTCWIAWAGSGHSIRLQNVDPHDNLGLVDLRFSTYGGQIALASSLAYETGSDDYPNALGTQGRAYIYNLDGTHVYTHQFYPTVSHAESLALSDSTLWIFDGVNVYEYDRADYLLKATIDMPSGDGYRIFVSQEGALCCANEEAQIFRWQMGDVEMEWNLLATLDDAVDDNDLPIPADYLGTENAHHMVRGSSVYAVVTTTKVLDDPYSWVYYVYPGFSGGGLGPEWGYPSVEAVNAEYAYGKGAIYPPTGEFVGWGRSFWFPAPEYGYRESYYAGNELIEVRPYPLVGEPVGRLLTYRHFAYARYYPDADYPPYGMFEQSTDITIVELTATLVDEDPHKYVDVYRKRLDVEVYDLTEPTLQQVVETLSYRAGLEEPQIDAEELASKNVHAFAVTQVGPTSAALELLMAAYRFYCVESEGKLKFKFLGAEPVRSIPYQDLGATFGDAPANPFPLAKGSELELPSMESVRYSNVSNDYQDGLESSDRLLQSIQSSRTTEYAIGLYPDEAKQIAVISQQVAVAGIIRVGPFSLGPEHRDLEPGDAITVAMQDGGSIQVLMTRVRYDRGVLEVEGVSYDAAAYLSDATTANNYTSAVTVRRPPDTDALIFDPPLLSDDLDGPKFAVVAKPSRFPWAGYSFQRSPDNNTYTEIFQGSSVSIFGTCSTALEVWSGGHVVDWRSTLTVNVGPGQLSSITRAELLSSRLNLAMVGDELLQFQRAELVTTGVYLLSGFIRYLGGTEWVSHAADEDFVLIEPSSISTVSLNLADRGVSRFYKAVTLGRSIDTADATTFAPDLVSMKPIAPANGRLIDLPTGDVLIRWVRRTRYQTNVLRGIVPLGEATEAYTVSIYDGTTLIRTINTTTTEATYTAAQQATDGVDAAVVRYEIRQVGQIEGYPASLEF